MKNVRKAGLVYQDQNGEYFESIEKDGEVVLSNPSYPFVFLWDALEPLKLIGSIEKHGNLIKKIDLQFYEGETLTVKVTNNGLEVQNEKTLS